MTHFNKCLLFVFVLAPLSLPAYNSASRIINLSSCSSCHGSTSVSGGSISLVDPMTGQPVSTFTAGRTYDMVISFQGQNIGGTYRNAYVLSTNGGTFLDNGSVGLVQGTKNARIVDSATANSVRISWVAPNTASAQFSALRMETNRNGGTGGDRQSQRLETLSLTATPMGTADATPPAASSSPAPTDNTSTTDPTTADSQASDSTTSPDSQFTGYSIQSSGIGGCGLIHARHSVSWIYFVEIFVFAILLGTVRRSRRQSNSH